MHSCVCHQGILVYEVLATDFTGELHFSMMSFRMSFHISRIHPHETAFSAGNRFRSVRFFHMGVQHKLLRICLPTRDTFEGSMDTVNDPQMSY